jgi:hypothetical protein
MQRKLRTRQHIIEDLSFNHTEKQVLTAGFTMYRITNNDYGYDGYIQLFKPSGEIDSHLVHFQLKSTDHIQYSKSKEAFTFDLSIRDLELWLSNERKMLLVLYDAQNDVAYYLDLQSYFKINRDVLKNIHKFVRVYFPELQVFNQQSVKDLHKLFQQS